MLPRLHALFAVLAFLCILTFWSATLVSELFLSAEAVNWVKQNILIGLAVFIPLLMATGASGFRLMCGRTSRLADQKFKRMPFIVLNGLLILLPSAFYLAHKAALAEFDALFYTVQIIELLAGALNLSLMTLNIRDGWRLSRRHKAP